MKKTEKLFAEINNQEIKYAVFQLSNNSSYNLITKKNSENIGIQKGVVVDHDKAAELVSKDLKEIESIDLEQFSKKIKKQKPKNIPQYLLCIPIFSPQRGLQGYLLLARNKNFNDNENELVQHLSRTYGHAYNTFLTNFSIKNFLKKNFTGKKRWITISVIILIFLFPVRMTSTAPVEVVAKNPFLITSPFDGVVKKIIANNNDL